MSIPQPISYPNGIESYSRTLFEITAAIMDDLIVNGPNNSVIRKACFDIHDHGREGLQALAITLACEFEFRYEGITFEHIRDRSEEIAKFLASDLYDKPVTGDRFPRLCELTGAGINSGYVYADRSYASRYLAVLAMHLDEEYDDTMQDVYYTEWEDGDEFEYVGDGEYKEID